MRVLDFLERVRHIPVHDREPAISDGDIDFLIALEYLQEFQAFGSSGDLDAWSDFISVHDGLATTTKCKVYLKTLEVFEIGISDIDENGVPTDMLDGEYIGIRGKKFQVVRNPEDIQAHNVFWRSDG